MKTRNTAFRSMMCISSPTASHLPVLEARAREVGEGLVIEHGAGIYSTPLLARLGCRVVCAEPHPAWAEWARWIYQDSPAQVVLYPNPGEIKSAALVFLDGPAKERGPLLLECLAAGVPTIIVHDTGKRTRREYGFTDAMFEHPAYDVTTPAENTTLWVRR